MQQPMETVETKSQKGLSEPYFSLSVADTLKLLDVSGSAGLTEEEVRRRALAHGPNILVSRRGSSAYIVLVHQFKSPVVYLLAAAATLAFYFRELEEGIAIAAVLALNALIGFLTELKAARSIEALRALGTRSSRVRREGHTRVVPADELVPGDIGLVEAGDSIAADMRIIEASSLAADESTLTGESISVEKATHPAAEEARLTERSSMLFKGTTITRGSGIGVVTATGLATEIGRISRLVAEAEPGSSPLERKLARLSGQLVWATLILAAALIAAGIISRQDVFLIVQAAIALAVAAIPEGLPIVSTLALARGMWRMAQQNALIERLSAVETLGATTVILTDKTGTLTENRMTVRRFWLSSGEIVMKQESSGSNDEALALRSDAQLKRLVEIAVLCNDASLGNDGRQPSGDPMEIALLRSGRRVGIERGEFLQARPLVRKYPFDSAHKMMATLHRHEGGVLFAVKGAPEAVLRIADRVATDDGHAAMVDTERAKWLERVDHLGHHGLRVLACATKTSAHDGDDPYHNLTFLGLIALEDPARADVPQAIQACRQAGIRVVMVTGDHAITARSIGRAVGIGGTAEKVVEGRELTRLRYGHQDEVLRAGIFARVSPSEKLELVRAYQRAGAVVAMTGDGVNDAPALRQADIGVAMGMRGTDAAREAAAMILLDDAFPTIVKAIREGRVIFGNIRRFVVYLLSCNLSEVMVVGLAIVLGLPLPILPLQILYLNLVTDVFPAFALAMGEGDRDVLNRQPRDPREPLLGRPQWTVIVLHSLALTAATFGALALGRLWLDLDSGTVVTVTFLTLAFAQLWHVFNMRHSHSGLVQNEVTRNPWLWSALALCTLLLAVPPYVPYLAHLFHLVAVTPSMWAVILGMSLAPLLVTQCLALITARDRRGTAR
jgi:P-type Ca2+ transporter type 2C